MVNSKDYRWKSASVTYGSRAEAEKHCTNAQNDKQCSSQFDYKVVEEKSIISGGLFYRVWAKPKSPIRNDLRK